MALFCLVHGSIQNASGWKLLTDALTNRRHIVIAPDLGGVDPSSGAAVYARVIAEAVDRASSQLSEPAWVLAHSASGMFLPWVAPSAARSQLAGLIYLAAYAPAPGKSLLGSTRAESDMFNPDWVGKDPMQDEIAREFLFHDCPGDALRWAMSTRRLMIARGAMQEPLPDGLGVDLPVRYISCRLDRTFTSDWMKRAARQRLGVEPIELECGHFPHVSMPEKLADVLVEVSKGVERPQSSRD